MSTSYAITDPFAREKIGINIVSTVTENIRKVLMAVLIFSNGTVNADL